MVIGRYSFERARIFDARYNESEKPQIDRFFSQVRLSSFSGAVVRDTRTDALDPSGGVFTSVESMLAGRAIESEVGFVRTFVQAFGFKALPTARRAILAGGARMGLASGFPQEVIVRDPQGNPVPGPDGQPLVTIVRDIPASERFFSGGATTVRGFGLDRLGTPEIVDSDGFSRGGDALLVLNAELRVDLRSGVSLASFLDAGNVFAKTSEIRFGSDSPDARVRRPLQIADRPAAVRHRLQRRSPAGGRPARRRAPVLPHAGTGILMTGLTLLFVAMLSANQAPPARNEVIDRVLAAIGTRIITLSDARAALLFGFANPPVSGDRIYGAMSSLIDRELMLIEVQRYLPVPTRPRRRGRRALRRGAIAVSDRGRVRDRARGDGAVHQPGARPGARRSPDRGRTSTIASRPRFSRATRRWQPTRAPIARSSNHRAARATTCSCAPARAWSPNGGRHASPTGWAGSGAAATSPSSTCRHGDAPMTSSRLSETFDSHALDRSDALVAMGVALLAAAVYWLTLFPSVSSGGNPAKFQYLGGVLG